MRKMVASESAKQKILPQPKLEYLAGGLFSRIKNRFDTKLIQAGIPKTTGEFFSQIKFIIVGLTLLSLLASIACQALFRLPIASIPLVFILLLLMVFLGIYLILSMKASSRADDIDNQLALLITYMGGLSTSQAARDDIFAKAASKKEEFGAAAAEIERVRIIAKSWNFGYIDATIVVAKTTPSRLFEDFLSRFSQALDSGEPLSEFLAKEQRVIIDRWSSNYRRKLKGLENLADAYLAVQTSLAFVSITVLMMITLFGGGGPVLLMLMLLIVFSANTALTAAHGSVAPNDPLCIKGQKTPGNEKLFQLMLFSLIIVLPLVLFAALIFRIPFAICLILVGLGFLPTGRAAEQYQKDIARRDENYPIFIRTLGGTSSALGGSLFDSVELLTKQHFGALTKAVRLLNARAKFGVEAHIVWDSFARETESNLIHKFMKLYVEGVDMGGDPSKISQFVSEIVERILELRKDRDQVVGSFRGSMYPLTLVIVGMLVFMETILRMLSQAFANAPEVAQMGFSFGQGYGGIAVDLYFGLLYVGLPLFASLALAIPQQGTMKVSFGTLSKLYILVGLTILIVGYIAQSIMGSFMGTVS